MVTALWRFLGHGWARWVVCWVVVAAVYVLMGRIGMRRQKISPRSYRYAE